MPRNRKQLFSKIKTAVGPKACRFCSFILSPLIMCSIAICLHLQLKAEKDRRNYHRQEKDSLEDSFPGWEAASKLSAFGTCGGVGDRLDVGKHAARVPVWEGSYER